jgi:hypothetical protein
MKILSGKEERWQKVSCLAIQKMVTKELNRIPNTTKRYKELIKSYHELKRYQKYFEYPSMIWAQTCMDRFYTSINADRNNSQTPIKVDWFLKFRIAASVSKNRGFTEAEFCREHYKK